VLSRGNARKNDGLDALATALAASGNERLAAVDPEAASEVLRLLSAVGAKTWWPSAPERSRQPARASTRPPPRRDSWNALGRSGRAHPARHTSAGLLLARPPPTSFGAPAPRIRTLNRKIVDLNERIESEVEASATTLIEIFGVGPILAARIIGTVGEVRRFPSKGHFASYSGTAPVEASSGEVVRHRLSLAGNRKLNRAPCTWSRYARPGRTLGAGSITARRSRRASPARKRYGASRGASRMPSSGASWRTRRRIRAAPLDKEEPRTP
jgi:transposase